MERSDIHIILDYGHGKNTAGKRSPLYSTAPVEYLKIFKQTPEFGNDRYYEYLSNRVIGNQIALTLKDIGYSVHETVTDDTDPALSTRANKANEICKKYGAGNCVFVSLHSNAAGNATKWLNARGWSAFTTKKQNNSDKLADCMYKFADLYLPAELLKIRKDMSDGDPDWEENFTVIYKANCPAVLVEALFYDNLEDLKYIMSEYGQAMLIKIVVEGIQDYTYNKFKL